MSAVDFDQPVIQRQGVDCFIAGDDENAIQDVYELVKTIGFRPVIAGELSIARILENMQLLLLQLRIKREYRNIAGWRMLQN